MWGRATGGAGPTVSGTQGSAQTEGLVRQQHRPQRID
jgi:hypothetical protein